MLGISQQYLTFPRRTLHLNYIHLYYLFLKAVINIFSGAGGVQVDESLFQELDDLELDEDD